MTNGRNDIFNDEILLALTLHKYCLEVGSSFHNPHTISLAAKVLQKF